MDVYEVLFDTRADEIDPDFDTLVRFPFTDVEGESYEETVQVSGVEFLDEHTIITGYSEVLNDRDEFHIGNDVLVQVLGG